MTTARLVATYLLTLVVFLGIDAIWLGVVARGFYKRELGHLLADDVRWGAAALFYALYVAGLLVLVVVPHRDGTLLHSVALGAVFGLCAYAAYDLTNLATLPRWSLAVTAIDMIWGAVLTGTTAAAGWRLARWLLR